MKKILATILAVSSVAAFADTFQDFNNNLYAQYGLTGYSNNAQTNGFGIGGTFQSKNDIWLNTELSQNNNLNGINSGNTFGLKAGYAFQFFGDDDNGLQIVPFASFGYAGGGYGLNGQSSVDAYKWGVGVQPEYRFLSSFKASLGMGLAGYNGHNSNNQSTTVFGFNVNPEVQYDIAKTVMVAVGYNYGTQFNDQNALNTNTVNFKVGYLF